ncbi:hypothetical protein, partial, partial [Parasitella parasitica]
IHVNINGHISSEFIPQHRGIRQGDPISPLLFNIAFDPFLRSIQQNSAFKGFNLPHEAPPHDELDDLADAFNNLYLQPTTTHYTMNTITNTLQNLTLDPPSPTDANQVKILAYADDTLLFHSQAGLWDNGIHTLLRTTLLIGMTAPHPHLSFILDILFVLALRNEMLPSNKCMILFAIPLIYTHNGMSLFVAG